MPKYIKKPIPIEAYKLPDRENQEEIDKFHEWATKVGFEDWYPEKEGIMISTLEGWMFCREGSYVIKGIKGEFYSCAADIFEESYDKVENENAA